MLTSPRHPELLPHSTFLYSRRLPRAALRAERSWWRSTVRELVERCLYHYGRIERWMRCHNQQCNWLWIWSAHPNMTAPYFANTLSFILNLEAWSICEGFSSHQHLRVDIPAGQESRIWNQRTIYDFKPEPVPILLSNFLKCIFVVLHVI